MTTSWIFADGAGSPGWSGVAELAPEVFDRYDEMRGRLGQVVPPRVIAMCRTRMATLLGIDLPRTQPVGGWQDDLPSWPDSPLFTEAERAALAVAEQFTVDVTGVEQGQIDSLLRYYSPEQTFALMSALWFEEALLRLGAVLGVRVPPAPAAEV